jgi:predicted DsbA family dithiol-disulfide isomerase
LTRLAVTHFTDPGCPFAFSAEPHRYRLRWLYGDQLEWETHMVVLSESPADYEEKGFTPEKQAASLERIQRRHGMPIDPRPRPRMTATVEACRAVVAARLRAPERHEALLRALRIAAMAGDLIDEPEVIDAAARDAGLDPAELRGWMAEELVEAALREDMAAARAPAPAAQALEHKLAPEEEAEDGLRYTCPSYEFARDDGRRVALPGFQPVEVYEAAVANLGPELERRDPPGSVAEVLAWAGEPLATAEVAAIAELDLATARTELARVASERPAGPDGYWSA